MVVAGFALGIFFDPEKSVKKVLAETRTSFLIGLPFDSVASNLIVDRTLLDD